MKKRFRKKGFVLLPVVLATFIIGMLGVGLASMYQSTFSTMSAGKAASQAKDFANVEGDYLKVTGYDDSSSVVHDWQDLSTVVGPDGASWQSKVEDTGRTQVSPTGDKVKVMKVSVRKNGELVSRYSQEVPLVDGKDVSSKAEIDSMMKVVDGQIQTLTNHVDTEVDRLDGDVAKVNSSLDALSKLVNNYHDQLVSDINAERTARESADTNLNNAVNKEVSDRKNAIAQSEAKLNQRIDDIQADIKKLHDSVNTNTANIKTNASNINTNKDNISKNASGIKTNADAIADINSRLATLRTDFDALSTKNTGVTNRVKAIEDRLNGNEFIKNATTGNSIKIGWDASSKALYGMVDGNKVPLSTQGNDNPTPSLFSDEGGYYKFPNGLIMQWGYRENVLFDEEHYEVITFPIRFNHKCLAVLTTTRQVEIQGGLRNAYVVEYNNVYAKILPGYVRDGGKPNNGFFWFAIGY